MTRYGGSGGGATHISTSVGLLSTLSDKRGDILIVAGGGGGYGAYLDNNTMTNFSSQGHGGGFKGVTSHESDGAIGGTQTAAGHSAYGSSYGVGSFGQGGSNRTTDTHVLGGAGGGGFYGGGAVDYSASDNGGGGSGYIGNSKLTNKVMYCYNCEESNEISTKTISINESGSHEENKANKGHGYAIITYVPDKDNDGLSIRTATRKIIAKVGECGLYQDEHGDYRYAGNNDSVCNYVTFNNETWRIIGIFDTENEVGGAKEKRIKLVRNDLIGEYSYDTSASGVNSGYGVNEWSVSYLMRELNGDYLNTNLTSNPNWYNGQNNLKTGTFDRNKVLNSEAQQLIDDVVWYLGGFEYGNHTVSQTYAAERGNTTGKICTGGNDCNDRVTRTLNWIGKVALPYPSDYGYASSACYNDNSKYIELVLDDLRNTTGHNTAVCKDSNWLTLNINYWLLSPRPISDAAFSNWIFISRDDLVKPHVSTISGIRPTVYLKSNVEIVEGDGTSTNPYKFTIK